MFFRRSTSEAVIYIFDSEVQAIVGEARRFPHTETGGDLFGTFTHGNMPVIWLASGPGPNAKHVTAHFEQDVSFTSEWQRRLMNEFGVQYVGSWHSHHTLSLNTPSGGDVEAARNYAARHHRQRTLEIIANHEGRKPKTVLRPYFYPNAQEAGWVGGTFTTLPGESPLRSKLGRDEISFSCGLDWKETSSNLFSLTSHKPSRETEDVPYSDAGSDIPEKLKAAIHELHYEGIEVEQRGEVFMVVIPLNEQQVLAVAVQNCDELNILQANLIDYAVNTNTNISERLVERGSPLRLNRETVMMMERSLPLIRSSMDGWRV
jgi:Prokaryotic homologs of the JAB domain